MLKFKTQKARIIFRKTLFFSFVAGFSLAGTYLLLTAKAISTYTPPSSIARDCSVDVTDPATINDASTNLQAWFNTVPDNSIVSLPSNVCYNTEYPFVIDSRNNITINGNNASFTQKTNGTSLTYSGKESERTRASVKIQESSGITINDLKVRGTRTGSFTGCYNASLEAQHGFTLNGSDHVTLNNVDVKDVWGDFVEFANGGGSITTNATVTGSTFSGAGRQGLGLTWVNGATISNSTFDTVCRSGIDIEPLAASSGQVHNITIQNTTWSDFNFTWFTAGGSSTNVTNVTVKNNTTDRMNVSVTSPSRGRSGFYLTGNKVSSPARNESSFGFDTIDDVVVQDNTYASSAGDPEPGVKLTDVNKARVNGNTLSESTPGVRLRGTVTDTIVKDNTYTISSGNKGYQAVLAYCTETSGGCNDGPFTNTATVYECNNTFTGKAITPCPSSGSPSGGGSNTGGGSTGGTTNNTPTTSNTSNPATTSAPIDGMPDQGKNIVVDSPSEIPKALLEILKHPSEAPKIIARNPGIFAGLVLLFVSLVLLGLYFLYKRSARVQSWVNALTAKFVHQPHTLLASGPTGNSPHYLPHTVIRPSVSAHDEDKDK